MKLALDANCFINAVNQQALSYGSVQRLLAAKSTGQAELYVSLHTLHELEQKPDEALDLAKSLPSLPYWPIGGVKELVGTINQLTGTLGDMRSNHVIQEELESLANSGNDLRDRGAFLDALHASMDAFVTDGQTASRYRASQADLGQIPDAHTPARGSGRIDDAPKQLTTGLTRYSKPSARLNVS